MSSKLLLEQKDDYGMLTRRLVQYHTHGLATRKRGGTGEQESRSSSCRTDSFAFLNEEIRPIDASDTFFVLNTLHKSYVNLYEGLKAFYEITGRRFVNIKEKTESERICEILDFAERDLSEIGINICVKKFENEDSNKELEFYLWKCVPILYDTLFVFYLSPIDNLPDDASNLYRRFIYYVSSCMRLCVMPEYSDNRYIDMMMNMDFDYDNDGDEEDDGFVSTCKDYSAGGRYYKAFESVRDTIDTEDELKRDLSEYISHCKDNDLSLLARTMLSGMDIVKPMNVNRYSFDPYSDTFDGDAEGVIDTASTVAFVYDDSGLEEWILECINSDIYSGVNSVGWNKWIPVFKGIKKDDIDNMLKDNTTESMFANWNSEYYRVIKKYL